MKLSTGISIIFVGSVLSLVGTILYLIADWLAYFGLFLLGVVGLFLLGLLLLSGFLGWEELLKRRAVRAEKQYQAQASKYLVIQDGFGMAHAINLETDMVENLSTYPGSHHNGVWVEPPVKAELAWHALVSKNKDTTREAMAQLPPIVESQKDLFTLIDEYPHTDIWNSTGAGKTSLCRSIGLRRKASGHQVVVLDSSEHPARWAGLERVASLSSQVETITRLFRIHERNSEALASGQAIESDFQQITVISEEWTDIIRELDRQGNDIARRFIDEMARKARKTGIHCVFTTQTNLAADLGLDGRYRVIRNFLQLEMTNHPERSFICNAVIGGFKLGEWQVPAPPPTPPMLSQGYVAPSLESLPEPEIMRPSLHEQKIMDLYDANNSFNEIARQVFGKSGGNQTKEIKAILSKYGYM